MKRISESVYLADEGKTFMRKENSEVYGTRIDIGGDDTIDDFKEVELTEENDIEGILKMDKRQRRIRERIYNKKKYE